MLKIKTTEDLINDLNSGNQVKEPLINLKITQARSFFLTRAYFEGLTG